VYGNIRSEVQYVKEPYILESQFLKKIHPIQSPIDNKVPCGSLNAAARRFIPKEDLEKEGYEAYVKLFARKSE
jgi:hypothetical protein